MHLVFHVLPHGFNHRIGSRPEQSRKMGPKGSFFVLRVSATGRPRT
jgi:hypothetical protein